MGIKENVRRGDVFYIYASEKFPVIGSEYHGGRPAVVVSNDIINPHSPVIEVCYLTLKKKKEYCTHVHILSGKCNSSIVLCEHITTVSKERIGDYITHFDEDTMSQIDEALLFSLSLTSKGKFFSSDKELHDLQNENNFLRQEVFDLQNKIEELNTELTSKGTCESSSSDSIYKDLYYDLLNRVIRK